MRTWCEARNFAWHRMLACRRLQRGVLFNLFFYFMHFVKLMMPSSRRNVYINSWLSSKLCKRVKELYCLFPGVFLLREKIWHIFVLFGIFVQQWVGFININHGRRKEGTRLDFENFCKKRLFSQFPVGKTK